MYKNIRIMMVLLLGAAIAAPIFYVSEATAQNIFLPKKNNDRTNERQQRQIFRPRPAPAQKPKEQTDIRVISRPAPAPNLPEFKRYVDDELEEVVVDLAPAEPSAQEMQVIRESTVGKCTQRDKDALAFFDKTAQDTIEFEQKRPGKPQKFEMPENIEDLTIEDMPYKLPAGSLFNVLSNPGMSELMVELMLKCGDLNEQGGGG